MSASSSSSTSHASSPDTTSPSLGYSARVKQVQKPVLKSSPTPYPSFSVDVDELGLIKRVEKRKEKRYTGRHNPNAQSKGISKALADLIPPEIINLILRQLIDDKQALMKCSLVAWEWFFWARCYLIPKKIRVHIDSYHCIDPLETLSLFEHPSSTIGRYVHHLSVKPPSNNSRSLPGGHMRDIPLDYRRFLHAFVPNCDALRSMSLSNLDLNEFCDPTSPPHLQIAFPHLSNLEIRRCTFQTYGHFFSFVSNKRRLQHLSLTDVHILQPDVAGELFVAPAPRQLRYLRIHTAGLDRVLDWTLAHRHGPRIKSLEVGGIMTWEDQESAIRFFRRHGPSIETIKLCLYSWSLEVDLGVCSNLRELYISHAVLQDSSTGAALSTVLNQITSSKIADITLHFINRPENYNLLNWSELARVFEKPVFSAFKRLLIILNVDDDEEVPGSSDSVGVYLRACFHPLTRRKILNLMFE
ncbi:hypothetical protein CPC08DRAFT_523655 [Agrocybe pediades]|nr:hypothetical protein CPC08DRAFT_523655 [Agrocybe pediades]